PASIPDVQTLVALLRSEFMLPVAPEDIALVSNPRLDDFRSLIWSLITEVHPLAANPSGDDTFHLSGSDGTLAGFRAPVRILGDVGRERIIYDAHAQTRDLNIVIGATEILGFSTSATLSYDAAVEEIEVRTGLGDDSATVALGRDADGTAAPDQSRRILVHGGAGSDEFNLTLYGQPAGAAEGPAASTVDVEHVFFTNAENPADTDWLISDNRLRAGTPDAYPQVVLETMHAVETSLRLADDVGNVDHLQVWSTLDDNPADGLLPMTVVDLRSGDDSVVVGQATAGDPRYLAHLESSLSLHGGSGANVLALDDRGATDGGNGAGMIGIGQISGFGMAAGAKIGYSAFPGTAAVSGLSWAGSDLVGYQLQLNGTAIPSTFQVSIW
ncbi:MAG: hypothetical protein JJ992_06045, partial [Planctomycetes bacterium]|nr:hypothetical protein [Planctomycetota bacterium]